MALLGRCPAQGVPRVPRARSSAAPLRGRARAARCDPVTHVRQKEMSFFSLFSSISPSTAWVCVKALTCKDITCLASV